ncbi:MAG: hypothetical protein AAFX00_14205 [Pseudomonadota bacterium]
MHRKLLVTAAVLGLTACEQFGLQSQADDPAFDVTSTNEILTLGGFRLEDDAILAQLSGANLVEERRGWTWEIRENGTQLVRADDGSWAESEGTWEVADGMLCRKTDEIELSCSEVWQLGDYYRFTVPTNLLDKAVLEDGTTPEEPLPEGSLHVFTLTQA